MRGKALLGDELPHGEAYMPGRATSFAATEVPGHTCPDMALTSAVAAHVML